MDKAKLVLDKDYEISKIDEKVFGSFVEPLGRCVYGGIYEPGHPTADEKGFRRDVLELTRPLNVTLNRFPGGNFVSTYRWEDGIGPKEKRPRRAEVAWQCIETNEFGLNEFADWSKLNGSDVMMTVNLATRGVLEAMDCVEYCNFNEGTYWSDLRISHGYKNPHGYRYWCLTNEIDGVWQVGQKTGTDYGRIAREASKGMKLLDDGIKTVLAGSSSPSQATFPGFDAAALEESYDFIDYLSIHQYIGNSKNDTPNYLAKPITTDAYLKTAASTIDYIKAKTRSSKKVKISFDEFNTWHSIAEEDRFSKKWRIAPPLLEDIYTTEDALALGGMLLAVLKNADRVEIACVSELVNCISHIRTRNGGGAWVLPPYYTFLLFSKYGRGTSLVTAIKSPKYDSTDFTDVPYLDAAATIADNGDLTIFAINRSLEETLPLETELRGFSEYKVAEHIVLTSGNPKDTNTEENPNFVTPKSIGDARIDGNKVMANLPKLSWNVIRLQKIK
ncbi:intracellular exo-alpha-(1-_5)-L-arabinofuranosidase [Ruminiclostridium hungatei]|uniref:non-reducing end alpha-L-arabinofuranosidase n=1 Tax=Ruminiclostridium hungatei TaxID=48256 RepID=A0A1V4SH16_RUMHU|nr:alpha-N-arabinofuranosidase [Ruminiclostridium hungatei]OPX42786.1 intracellular exo-alpha-(1->5)-L-arabinofuranosidase [Ruminiclostridium hungatei]